jgi:hypothetical protein
MNPGVRVSSFIESGTFAEIGIKSRLPRGTNSFIFKVNPQKESDP